MKNLIKTIAYLMTLLVLGACEINETVMPSGNITSQERVVKNYDGVQVEATIIADIKYSDTEESIVIEADDNLHQYVEVAYINNTLRIKLKNNLNIKGRSTLKAHIITRKTIEKYSASGASQIYLIDSRTSDKVSLNLSGASRFNGGITSNSLSVGISGASYASISGETGTVHGTLSGASQLQNFDMAVNDATLDLSGASNVSLTINGDIDLRASGASSLTYKGNGSTVRVDLSGGSQIIKI